MSKEEKKYDKGKLPVGRMIVNQFPQALKGISLVSAFGDFKYDTGIGDSYIDIKNSKGRYKDACIRHFIEGDGIDDEMLVSHKFAMAWNALASLEIFIKENNINVEELYKEVLPKWKK